MEEPGCHIGNALTGKRYERVIMSFLVTFMDFIEIAETGANQRIGE